MRDEIVQHRRVKCVRVVRNVRLFGKHDLLGRLRVGREQAPIDVATVTKVGVVRVLRGKREDVLHHLLGLCGALQEELDCRREHLRRDGRRDG
eukprot:scaffold9422_cov31-Tisochrysis_lutea.AAC.1